jgi:site-specific DNA-cytosine methylase
MDFSWDDVGPRRALKRKASSPAPSAAQRTATPRREDDQGCDIDVQKVFWKLVEEAPPPPAALPGCLRKGLLVGSACSGWSSELFSLKAMNIDFTPLFGCDIAGDAKLLSQSEFQFGHWFDDVSDESFRAAPFTHLFVAGCPCQPFSMAGKREGVADPRGTIQLFAIRYIYERRPLAFLFENVAGLCSGTQKTFFAEIVTLLASFKDDTAQPLYQITWKKLNLKTHGSLPHNRERVFVVGILASKSRRKMRWPDAARNSVLNARYTCLPGDVHDVLKAVLTCRTRLLGLSRDKQRMVRSLSA